MEIVKERCKETMRDRGIYYIEMFVVVKLDRLVFHDLNQDKNKNRKKTKGRTCMQMAS